MLTLENISYNRQFISIFKDIGFSIGCGSGLIIKGSNGIGKTTLLQIIAGLIQQDRGRILWQQEEVQYFREYFNGDMQFITCQNFLKPQLSIRSNLQFYAKLSATFEAVESAINFFKLTDFAETPVKYLSSGVKQKAKLAKLLACPATLWLLDEPSNHLDEEGANLLKSLILTRIKENGIVIIATHDKSLFDIGPNINLQDFKH